MQMKAVTGVTAAFLLALAVPEAESSSQLSAQTQQELAAPANCRYIEHAIDASGSIVIRPGAVYCFQVALNASGVTLTQSKRARSPEGLLSMRLFKESGTSNHYLYVTNGTPYSLKYSASIRSSAGASPSHTPTCPVPAHAAALEHWPYAVIELQIESIRMLESLTNVSCD
jgi:hypothetical protein